MRKCNILLAAVLAFSPFAQAGVVLSESFDKFTEGSESSYADIANLDDLTASPGWTAEMVQQAGGCAYLGVGGSLGTPALNLSANGGNYSVSFRAKSSTPGALYFIMDSYMGYAVDYISDQWTQYTISMTGGTFDTVVYFLSTYNDLLIDDIVIDDGGVGVPIALPATEFTRESFTANWMESINAQTYMLNVFTLDYDVQTTVFTRRYIVRDKEVSGTSCKVTEGEFDEPYYYTVSGKAGDVISEPSSVITVSPESVEAPVASGATNVTATDFIANWAASDLATKYYVHVLKQHKAAEAETYVITDTDFSDVESEGTVDAPHKELEWLFDGDWAATMPVIADGIIGINNQDFDLFGQAFLQSPALDLTQCGGNVSISFDAFSRKGLSKAMVRLANYGSAITFADTREFDVTEQSAHFEYTLTGGNNISRIVITSEEMGMMFIDNLKVTVELPEGTTFVTPVRTVPATDCQTYIDRLGATDSDVIFYYVVASWAVRHEQGAVRQIPEILSEPSGLIRVDRPASFLSDIASDTNQSHVTALAGAISVSNPGHEAIAIYTPDGRCVVADQSPSETCLYNVDSGIYIVTVGGSRFKVSVQR